MLPAQNVEKIVFLGIKMATLEKIYLNVEKFVANLDSTCFFTYVVKISSKSEDTLFFYKRSKLTGLGTFCIGP